MLDVAQLYQSYRQPLWRYVRRHADSRLSGDDVDDIVADTFERVLRASDRYRDEGKPMTWLATIAQRLLIDNNRRRHGVTLVDLVEVDGVSVPPPSIDLIDIRAALARLPARQRDVLVARYGHDLKLQQVAALLGTSYEGAKKRQRRALTNMHAMMEAGNG